MAAMVVTLQEYLAGHLVERGLHAFEDALNGPVKEGLRTAFPNVGAAAEEYAADLRQYEEDTGAWEVMLDKAAQEEDAALLQLKAARKQQRKEARKMLADAKRKHATLAKRKPQPPMDVWLRKARSVLGERTRDHTHATGAWDTFALVQVLRGFLEEVFVPRFGIDDLLEAKGLLSLLLRASEARSLRAHGAMPTESAALALLHSLAAALRRCGLLKPAQEVDSLLAEAQGLKRAALATPGSELRVKIAKGAQQKLLLYRAILDFERRLDEEAGPFQHKDGTYALGERISQWTAADQALVRAQGIRLREVAMARHWLFHHTENAPDGAAVLPSMGEALLQLRGTAARNAKETAVTSGNTSVGDIVEWPWTWPSRVDLKPTIAVLLQLSTGGMSIPVPKERCLLGRNDTIATVMAALLSGTGARVLLHGQPGMGKDVVAAEVVRSKEIAAAGLQLQAWLQASTDAMLRHELVDLFNAQLPQVVINVGNGEEEQLAAIRGWLVAHNDWLLVLEDATWATTALWKYIPKEGGRLLVTSQSPLSQHHSTREQEREGGRQGERQRPLEVTLAVELEGLNVSASLALLRHMRPFSKVKVEGSGVEACSSELELQYICAKAQGEAMYVYAPGGESDIKRRDRQQAIVNQLIASVKKNDRKKRLERLQEAQLEYRQLMQHPGLRQFLSEDLGNVPLLVSFCGHLLRSMGSVEELIEHHRRVPLQQQQQAGRNPMTDSHYLGAARSVALLLQRLESSGEEHWPAALRLLQALALLPSRKTPASLFHSPDERHVVVPLRLCSPSCSDEGSRLRFEEARRLLLDFGLAREWGEGRAPVVLQLVQRVVREQPRDAEAFAVVLQNTRQVLRTRIEAAAVAADFMAAREVLLCAKWWCDLARTNGKLQQASEFEFLRFTALHLLEERDVSEAVVTMHEEILELSRATSPHRDTVTAMINLAAAYHARGRHSEALPLQQEALQYPGSWVPTAMNNLAETHAALGRQEEAMAMHKANVDFYELTSPLHHTHRVSAMNNLASTYAALGRYEDALVMRTKVLSIRRQTLPSHHLDIAAALDNLAQSYGTLGRHEEAAARQEEVLLLSKRSLPPDHPDIAVAMNNLASSYGHLGRSQEAAAMHEEVTLFSKRTLHPDHPKIAAAMNNLAMSYARLGRYEEAEAKLVEALHLRERILPSDHVNITLCMENLVSVFKELGKYEEAAAMQEKVLRARRRSLPQEHPHIATAIGVLGSCSLVLGRFQEAAARHEEALQLHERILPLDHPDITAAKENLALSYSALGRHEEAVAMHEEVLLWRKRILPPNHPHIAAAKETLALAYSALGRHEEAAAMQEEVLLLRKRILPSDHPDIAAAMANLAVSCISLGRPQEAVAMLEEALQLRKRTLPRDHPDMAMAMNNLASGYFGCGEQAEYEGKGREARAFYLAAEAQAKAAMHMFIRTLPPGHPHIAGSTHILRDAKGKLKMPPPAPLRTNAERLRAAKARARQRGRG